MLIGLLVLVSALIAIVITAVEVLRRHLVSARQVIVDARAALETTMQTAVQKAEQSLDRHITSVSMQGATDAEKSEERIVAEMTRCVDGVAGGVGSLRQLLEAPDPRIEELKRAIAQVVTQGSSLRARIDQGLLARTPQAFTDDAIAERLKAVCAQVGLARTLITPDYDIAASGKLNEVIAGLAQDLGLKHPVRTAADITTLFAEIAGQLQG